MVKKLNEQIAAKVEERFYRSLYRYLYEEDNPHKDKSAIHVTSLIHDCMRRVYYYKMDKSEIMKIDGAIRVGVGKKIHEISFEPDKTGYETRLEWEGIVGVVDEYQDAIITDKKTTRNIPKYPNSHHALQVEYYKVLLEENGYPVVGGVILYIDVDNARIKAFPLNLRSVEDIKSEMLEKKAAIVKALKEKVPPPRVIGWLCSYCDNARVCFSGD